MPKCTEKTILIDDCLNSLFTVPVENASYFNVRNLETGELKHTIDAGQTLLNRKHALQSLKEIIYSRKHSSRSR